MKQKEIKKFIESFKNKLDRAIVIVDYGNVEKWKHSTKWKVGIRELARLVKNFSKGNRSLRRFYYGADYGRNENFSDLSDWSKYILETAKMNGFEIISKRVKYIHSKDNVHGFEKKCDLDVEMAVDLIRKRDSYDTIILFSGDGDLMCAIRYLCEEYKKQSYVFGARDHTGREVFDAQKDGVIKDVLFAEDFEYRLNMNRFINSR